MSWRFRQSFKIVPGLRLNLSKSGVSASIGGAPFTVNLGPRGLNGTASIPGTGLSFRQHFGEDSHRGSSGSRTAHPTPDYHAGADTEAHPIREIRSAGTELLTSQNLRYLKDLLQATYQELEEIRRALLQAKEANARASRRFNSWNTGFLLKNIFKSAFTARQAEAEIAAERVGELEEQIRLTTVATQIELEQGQAEAFFKMRDDFTGLSECAAIWDVKAEQRTDKFRDRTTAESRVSRERVEFSLASCELIQWDQPVPHLQNAKGGDMFLYPGFILYRASRTAFSVIDCHDVKLIVSAVRFQEDESVPSDSTVIGQTWAKANKDGSPDRRFANNHEIPIVRYGQAEFKTVAGLWEEFEFSNTERLERFAKSWYSFVASFGQRVSVSVNDEVPQDTQPAISPPETPSGEVHFECTVCHQPIEVNADAGGQEFRCPGCGEQLTVPESAG